MVTTKSNIDTVAGGSTALINLRPGGTHIEKVPYPGSRDYHYHLSVRDLRREYDAYQRLPQHPRFLQLHSDSSPERLVLPYLNNGCLHSYLREMHVSAVRRLQFAADAAEGLHMLHTHKIVHGDVNSWNFLVDPGLRLCVIDFAGSTIDGKAGSAFEGPRYCLPRSMDDPSTVATDLFALGSLMYEISTCKQPYQGYSDQEVEDRFRNRQFPCTLDLSLGEIIIGC